MAEAQNKQERARELATYIFHIVGRDGLAVPIDGTFSNDDDVEAGASATCLPQRKKTHDKNHGVFFIFIFLKKLIKKLNNFVG